MSLQIKIPALFILYFITISTYAQVGIGTTSPTAELEIATTNTGIPALEINPQTAPVGTVTGQLAVIDDELYMYDATRAKWLSVGATAIQFGASGFAVDSDLLIGGDAGNSGTGALMPYNGAIIMVTAQTSGGTINKGFYLRLNGADISYDLDSTLSGQFNLVGGTYINSSYNIDFNSGDYLSTRPFGNLTFAKDPVVIIWVKWRM